MNITEANTWHIVRQFLVGELDHADARTRYDIAGACAGLDARANMALHAGPCETTAAWDGHLCRITTEEP
jgi:hypothetical protein